ncbi:MAG: PKD domain-containing protein [Vicinamibacterales bacterium]
MSRASSLALLVVAAIGVGACTVKKTEVPPLSGPSELGLSLTTKVSPDLLKQDGASIASVEITARGADGRPARAVQLRVEIIVNGAAFDYGKLSTRTVVTGDDGVARLTYTAPLPLADPIDPYTVVNLAVTPVGTDFAGSVERYVEIRLVPPDGTIILPPNSPPVAAFTVTPTPVKAYVPVTFDASATKDEGAPCGSACAYSWDFGDGSQATGMVTSHEFRASGTYAVRLTVMDVRGSTSTTSQSITVTATARPTASFTYSPAEPRFGQEVFFNAASSTAAEGLTIVAYDWDFGTGRTGSGMTVAKRYDVDLIPPGALPGDDVTFNVTLTVTDSSFSPNGVGVVTQAVKIKVP